MAHGPRVWQLLLAGDSMIAHEKTPPRRGFLCATAKAVNSQVSASNQR